MQYIEKLAKISKKLEKIFEFNLEENEKTFPQFCNIEKLAKFSKKLEKVVEFDLEEKEKFPIIVFVKKK